MSAKLIIQSGHRQGEIIPLGVKKKMLLGRDINCDIQIFDKGLSRNHTLFEQRGHGFYISDLSSTNGTYVNGNLILSKELEPNDLVRVGNTEIRFLLADEASASSSVKLIEEGLDDSSAMISKRLGEKTIAFFQPQPDESSKTSSEEKSKALALMYEIGNLINAEKDLKKLFNTIMDIIMQQLKAYRGYLLMQRNDGETFEPVVIRRGSDENVDKEVTISSTIVREAIKNGKSILTSDASSDARFKAGLSVRLNDIKSVMCVPVESNQKILGAIYVDSRGIKNAFTEFDLQMLTAIGKQAGIAIHRTQLMKHYFEKEKIQHSLLVARNIQRSLLPRKVPKIEGIDVIGVSISCDETGGDYYDFIPLNDEEVGIVVGDVSGHGIGAALVMASARAYLRAFSTQTFNLPEILVKMNELLSQDLEEDRFITLIYCKLNRHSQKLRYTSAGHDEPIFFRAATQTFNELDSTGIPLGMLPEQEFPEGEEVTFEHGDILVLSTDGVWEAINQQKEAFGKDRLKNILKLNQTKTANQLINIIYDEVKQFIGEAPLKDDLTIVVIKAEKNTAS